MRTKLTIDVPEEIAQAYRQASKDVRERVEKVMAYTLLSADQVAAAYRNLSNRLGAEAKANGLTPEILDEILSEEDDA